MWTYSLLYLDFANPKILNTNTGAPEMLKRGAPTLSVAAPTGASRTLFSRAVEVESGAG